MFRDFERCRAIGVLVVRMETVIAFIHFQLFLFHMKHHNAQTDDYIIRHDARRTSSNAYTNPMHNCKVVICLHTKRNMNAIWTNIRKRLQNQVTTRSLQHGPQYLQVLLCEANWLQPGRPQGTCTRATGLPSWANRLQ